MSAQEPRRGSVVGCATGKALACWRSCRLLPHDSRSCVHILSACCCTYGRPQPTAASSTLTNVGTDLQLHLSAAADLQPTYEKMEATTVDSGMRMATSSSPTHHCIREYACVSAAVCRAALRRDGSKESLVCCLEGLADRTHLELLRAETLLDVVQLPEQPRGKLVHQGRQRLKLQHTQRKV